MRNRIVTIVTILISIIFGVLSWAYQESGFPDGYISAYGRLYNAYLFPIFAFINGLFFCVFLFLLIFKKKAHYLFFLYGVFIILSLMINSYLIAIHKYNF